MKRLNVNTIREQNLWLVFQQIAEGDQVTRSDIAARTGLSLMTVSNMLEPLLSEGIVREEKGVASSVGRRPSSLQLNSDARWIIVLDLASRDFSYFVLDLALKEVESGEYENNHELTFEENLVQFLGQLQQRFIDRDYSLLIGVGVSVAGPYQPEQDMVFCERIPELRQFGLKKIIKSFFNTQVFIDEDVKLAAKAVMTSIKANEMLYLYAGEGIGAGVIIRGQIYRGCAGFSGQVGQMILNGDNFEDLASFKAFEKRILARIPEINQKAFKKEVKLLYQNKNPILIEELEYIADIFAKIIHNIRCLIDSEIIIVDGEYNIFGKDFLTKIYSKLPETSWHPSTIPLKIIMSQSPIKSCVKGVGLQIRDIWVRKL
jgi:predicted NBD/HSP70 family sugar kinase